MGIVNSVQTCQKTQFPRKRSLISHCRAQMETLQKSKQSIQSGCGLFPTADNLNNVRWVWFWKEKQQDVGTDGISKTKGREESQRYKWGFVFYCRVDGATVSRGEGCPGWLNLSKREKARKLVWVIEFEWHHKALMFKGSETLFLDKVLLHIFIKVEDWGLKRSECLYRIMHLVETRVSSLVYTCQ